VCDGGGQEQPQQEATGRLNGSDFELEASDYASSFNNLIYPGRHVPDVCGLVSQIPRVLYIMLPVEPGDFIDNDLSPPAAPSRPATQRPLTTTGRSLADERRVTSDRGVCALLKQAQPGQAPDLVKPVLKASAGDVVDEKTAMGDPADDGVDGATGAGLLDAEAAYRITRSRGLFTAPPPR